MRTVAVLNRIMLVVSVCCAALFVSTPAQAQSRRCDNANHINCYWDGARNEWLMRDASSTPRLDPPPRQQPQGNRATCPLGKETDPYDWQMIQMMCTVGASPVEKKKNCEIVQACKGLPGFK